MPEMTEAQEQALARLQKKYGTLIVNGRQPDGDVGVTFQRDSFSGRKTVKAKVTPSGLIVEGQQR